MRRQRGGSFASHPLLATEAEGWVRAWRGGVGSRDVGGVGGKV